MRKHTHRQTHIWWCLCMARPRFIYEFIGAS